jgi:iron(III) transport system substrate-binding protein
MRLSKIAKFLALSGLLVAAGPALAQKTQLLVYTALETDQLKAYQEGFNKVPTPTSTSSGCVTAPA